MAHHSNICVALTINFAAVAEEACSRLRSSSLHRTVASFDFLTVSFKVAETWSAFFSNCPKGSFTEVAVLAKQTKTQCRFGESEQNDTGHCKYKEFFLIFVAYKYGHVQKMLANNCFGGAYFLDYSL